MGRFLDVAHEGAVDFDFRAFPGFAVVGGQLGSPFDLGIRRRHIVAGQDDVGAGLVLDVEPEVIGMGFLQGQEVILPVVAADPDIEAVGLEGQDILGRFFLSLSRLWPLMRFICFISALISAISSFVLVFSRAYSSE